MWMRKYLKFTLQDHISGELKHMSFLRRKMSKFNARESSESLTDFNNEFMRKII